MAAPVPSLWDNPLGTDGFEFIEYAAPDPAAAPAFATGRTPEAEGHGPPALSFPGIPVVRAALGVGS